MAFGLRSEGLPALDMWEAFRRGARAPAGANGPNKTAPNDRAETTATDGHKPETSVEPVLHVYEDNNSAITVGDKGYSKQLRHVSRTHRVNIAWVSEVLALPDVDIHHIDSARQAADILTKQFTQKDKFDQLRKLVGISSVGSDHVMRVVVDKRPTTFACVTFAISDQALRHSSHHPPAMPHPKSRAPHESVEVGESGRGRGARAPADERMIPTGPGERGARAPAESSGSVAPFASMLADVEHEERLRRGARAPADHGSRETPRDACLRRFLRCLAILVGDDQATSTLIKIANLERDIQKVASTTIGALEFTGRF